MYSFNLIYRWQIFHENLSSTEVSRMSILEQGNEYKSNE